MRSFLTEITIQSIGAGLLAAIVGYVGSVALVIQGLAAAGAGDGQIISALVALGLSQCVAAIALCWMTRMPLSIAWSTPGMALLATFPMLEGGFQLAVGAFVIVGGLIMLAGLWTPLGRFVGMIPKPIANAMLAGILLKLCLAPFAALSQAPFIGLLLIVTWLIVGRFARLWAAPAALAVAIAAFIIGPGVSPVSIPFPHMALIKPIFAWQPLISIALPLFIVAMASQNIPGLTVLSAFGYWPNVRQVFLITGGLSAITAFFGAPPINLAAITAALCAGPDAHADPSRRYWAAISAGLAYAALGGMASVATVLVMRSSPVLIEGVAGLALIGTLGSATVNAMHNERDRIPALMTFLVTASGFMMAGIGSAFWGLLAGLIAHALYTFRRRGDIAASNTVNSSP